MPNSPSAASEASCIIGTPDDEGPRLQQESLGLRWSWRSRRRNLEGVDVDLSTLDITEAQRWRTALDRGLITMVDLSGITWRHAFIIPPILRADRVFLVETRHAPYIEAAREYLDGTSEVKPLQRCRELWAYPSPFARSDLRTKMTHTLQASKAFRVFLHTRDWDLFGVTPSKPGRFDSDSELGLAPSQFPSIPFDMLEAWPSAGLPFDIPMMATYFGMKRPAMTGEVAARYDAACRQEFALFIVLSLHTEAVTTRRLWKLSDKCVEFIREHLSANLPPLALLRSTDTLPVAALLEKVDHVEKIPAAWYVQRRLGIAIGHNVGWDEDAKRGVQIPPPSVPGSSNRPRRRGAPPGCAQPMGAAVPTPFPVAPRNLQVELSYAYPTGVWSGAVGTPSIIEAARLWDHEAWTGYQVLCECNAVFENQRARARSAEDDAAAARAETKAAKEEVAELKAQVADVAKSASTRVDVPGTVEELGQVRTDLTRIRAERNCLREEVDGLRAQLELVRRQRDEWRDYCDDQRPVSRAARGTTSARARAARSRSGSPSPRRKRSRSTESLLVVHGPAEGSGARRNRARSRSRTPPRRGTTVRGRARG